MQSVAPVTTGARRLRRSESMPNKTPLTTPTTQRQYCYNGCDLHEIGDVLHPGKIVFDEGHEQSESEHDGGGA